MKQMELDFKLGLKKGDRAIVLSKSYGFRIGQARWVVEDEVELMENFGDNIPEMARAVRIGSTWGGYFYPHELRGV